MEKVKVSCVSYTNSLPFIFGLKNFADHSYLDVSLDIPADCYEKLLNDDVDLGLVPVVALRKIKGSHIVSPYCIGAKGPVKSVIMVSKCKIEEIKEIYLDYQSRTSVELIRILARKYWKINPEFKATGAGYEKRELNDRNAMVIIGDRTFAFYNKGLVITDLGEEWLSYSKKPFVFACWIANKRIDDSILEDFTNSLRKGLNSRAKIIQENRQRFIATDIDPEEYFFRNINYIFDESSREGLELFLNLMQ